MADGGGLPENSGFQSISGNECVIGITLADEDIDYQQLCKEFRQLKTRVEKLEKKLDGQNNSLCSENDLMVNT